MFKIAKNQMSAKTHGSLLLRFVRLKSLNKCLKRLEEVKAMQTLELHRSPQKTNTGVQQAEGQIPGMLCPCHRSSCGRVGVIQIRI